MLRLDDVAAAKRAFTRAAALADDAVFCFGPGGLLVRGTEYNHVACFELFFPGSIATPARVRVQLKPLVACLAGATSLHLFVADGTLTVNVGACAATLPVVVIDTYDWLSPPGGAVVTVDTELIKGVVKGMGEAETFTLSTAPETLRFEAAGRRWALPRMGEDAAWSAEFSTRYFAALVGGRRTSPVVDLVLCPNGLLGVTYPFLRGRASFWLACRV